MQSIKYYYEHPSVLALRLLDRFGTWLPDKTFLKLKFSLKMGYNLDLSNPQSFNEKIQWLKLYDRKPIYSTMVDKIRVKDYVANIIGKKYIIPTIAVFDSIDDIKWDILPSQFVLKCNHDSGGIVICKDKSKFDKISATKKLKKAFNHSYFNQNREWPYKSVPHKIICEKYMEDESGWQLKDYKIFCFNGEPKFIEVDYDRYVGHKLNVYDLNWNFIDFYMTSPNDKNVKIEKPLMLDKMLDFARKLSNGITFVRVDFYSINNDIYFGELTFHPGSGMIDFHPKDYDRILGNMLILPINN